MNWELKLIKDDMMLKSMMQCAYAQRDLYVFPDKNLVMKKCSRSVSTG